MKLKVDDLKYIIKEEIQRLFESLETAFWINRFGNRVDVKNTHYDFIRNNPDLFFTPDEVERFDLKSREAMKEYRAVEKNSLAYQNGAVRVRDSSTPSLNQRNVKGIRKYVRQNLDDIISNDRNKTYTVEVLNKNGEKTIQEMNNMSLSEFMNEFGSRKKSGSKSKVARFR